MNLLYEISSLNYTPISFKGRYFYDYYEIINSFLKSKLTESENKRLLKPILENEGMIKWYGQFDGDFQRITEFDANRSDSIKTELHVFIEKMQQIGRTLKSKTDQENQDWGNLIINLFQHKLVILIANEKNEWALLWGWDFLSNSENMLPILPPDTKPIDKKPIIEDAPKPTEIKNEIKNDVAQTTVMGTIQPDETEDPESGVDEEKKKEPIVHQQRMGCWGRIRHWLRWISYRFWGLFWLLIYTLLIIWLCRYCNRPNCDAYCEKLTKTKKELQDLERRVRERCDTTYQKPN